MRTLEEKILVMQACARGETIQASTNDGWADIEVNYISWNWSCNDYRIKPTPKKRLMRPEEFPAVFWVNRRGYPGYWRLVVAIWENSVVMADQNGTDKKELSYLAEDFMWSPDRSECRSFFEEERE